MPKKIVICSDGTWNKRERGDEKNTNVARIWEALVHDEQQGQVTFYDPGVGTGLSKFIGGATGYGMSQNIRDCYGALVERYHPGDEIFLFGFSRGAYTMRSLAGLIYACGLLKDPSNDLIKQAYKLYRDNERKDKQWIFKARHSWDVGVKMIGVWDTVGALGIPVGWTNQLNPFFHKFHDTKLNPDLKFCYHALAIDEQRKTFAPTLWDESNKAAGQTIEQVWFPGVHSDVGGGYSERGLADISLAWMISKAQKHGLLFKEEHLERIKPDHNALLHDSRAGVKRFFRKKVREISVDRHTAIHVDTQHRAWSDQCLPNGKYNPANISKPTDLTENYAVTTPSEFLPYTDLDTAA